MARNLHPWIANDLVPATGQREADPALTGAAVIAADTLGQAVIGYAAHERTIAAFDRARRMGVASGSGRKMAIAALGPSASGKTTAMRTFAASAALGRPAVAGRPAEPVKIIQLDANCTTRRLWVLVLEAHDDPVGRGTEEELRARAYATMRRAGTEMLVFDEIQHLVRAHAARDVTDTIKRILDDGVVTLGLVGVDAAAPLIKKNIQLANRMLAPAHITRLEPKSTADRGHFGNFLKALDGFIVDQNLLPGRSGLDDDRILRCLFVVSGGVVGVAVNLVRQAMMNAIERGASRIEPFDLSATVDQWAIPTGVYDVNPFPVVFDGKPVATQEEES